MFFIHPEIGNYTVAAVDSVGSVWVLWLPPAVQKHAGFAYEVNWKLYVDRRCVCECECLFV